MTFQKVSRPILATTTSSPLICTHKGFRKKVRAICKLIVEDK